MCQLNKQKLKIADRMERMEESEAYIRVKDHKEDFHINKVSD